MLTPTRYHFRAAALPLALALFLALGSLYSCSENPPTQGKDSCDTCEVPCDTCEVPCDTCNIDKDSASHAFTWTEYSIPGVSSLTGAAVYSDDKIYVFGRGLYIFNGTSFVEKKVYVGSTTRSPNFADRYIFPLAPEHYWAVNYGGAYYGDAGFVDEYRDLTPYSDGTLRSCWGTSKNDMFFVGDSGAVTHFDGTTWTKMPRVTTKNLRSVWGTSHNDVWACGFNSSTAETVLIHYDGTSWKEDEISMTKGIYATGGFNGVWASDSAGHKFVTTSGALLIRKTDNNPWRSDSGLVPNGFGGGEYIGISPRGNTVNDFFVIGGWGFIAHWNGKTWHKYDELYDYNNPVYGASAFSVKGNTECIVGVKSGTSWIAIGRRKPF